MAIEIVSLGEREEEYSFRAQSLMEALEKMRHNGPEGMFGRCSIDVQFKSFDRRIEVHAEGSSGTWRAVASLTRGVIQYEIIYEVPNWRNIETIPTPIQAEWNRFLRCLWIHERGHPPEELPILEEYKNKFEELRGVGIGRSEQAAMGEADRDIAKKRTELTAEIKQKREEARNQYDLETNHGETQGVYLNLEIDREMQGSSHH